MSIFVKDLWTHAYQYSKSMTRIMRKIHFNRMMHKGHARLLLIFIIPLTFVACKDKIMEEDNQEERRLQIEMEMADEVKKNLVGTWTIDTLNFEVGYYPYFETDTTLVKFGELNFASWENIDPYTNPYYNWCEIILRHEDTYYPIRLEYLLLRVNVEEPEKSNMYSLLYPSAFPEGVTYESNPFDLNVFGIIDNVEIIKINDDEYVFRGLNRGMKRMKIKRI